MIFKSVESSSETRVYITPPSAEQRHSSFRFQAAQYKHSYQTKETLSISITKNQAKQQQQNTRVLVAFYGVGILHFKVEEKWWVGSRI